MHKLLVEEHHFPSDIALGVLLLIWNRTGLMTYSEFLET